MIDIAAIYRDLAWNRYSDLWFEIECAYSVVEFDLVRDRIAAFESDPLGARLVPDSRCCITGEPGLRAKYRWERQYWGQSQMALVP